MINARHTTLMIAAWFAGLPFLLLAGASQPPVKARHGMVVSSHRLASEVGVQILQNGGNAVDAAIATGFALAVTLPSAGNLGGGGFMIVHMADGRISAFDFREKAPAAAHAKMYLNAAGVYDEPINHEGYLAIGVPGTVAGFFLAHERFGRKAMKELIAPAIKLAEQGFPVSWGLHEDFRYLKEEFLKYPASAKVFLKNGREVYQPGELWKQPDLARTLRRIQAGGRAEFYRGETARLIAAAMRKHGGLITEQDLAAYEAKERQPIHGTYRGYDIYSMCPPSSGGIALVEMLNILEGFDLRAAGFGSAQHLHLLAEVMRRAFADRARHLGDPDFNPDMPVAKLISKEYAADLRRQISLTRASPSDPEKFNEAHESSETTHYSVVDAAGNAVVVTYTLEDSYGSKIVAEGMGFLLNNEMGDFNPQPGRTDSTGLIGTPPNVIAPGKRMLSSMTPTIIARNGKPFLLIGSPGGRTIINTVVQVVSNVIDFEMDISEAIAAPRVHHQWLPNVLRVEKFGISNDTQRLLESYGHRISVSRSSRSQGSAMGILLDPVTGLRLGAADPRASDGAAVGY
ncbi:MAG: gamma-glutamyltransferase [candidate division KSB1 bacterium]|nr:gamma-glutamyltransferase [candidate division KSB1 bacterium]MDZ7275549.1 gamma-glutamyltransferase [candidate division KSB1 bacterium]MDZ7286139.1 gamma-glutamyltransferase [candidate division KSB1 bacterium]MDZ7296365.1 gamma-glutamyltransferase [candidate division KSB1 bacterium]MDZ7307141.1 gamma-glutamyltransferase [candidate division KSB1 bacterium]